MRDTNGIPPELTHEDEQHLKWLTWGHYGLAALTVLIGCFPLIHFFVGLGMLTGNVGSAPIGMGAFFMIIAVVIVGFFWSVAAAMAYAGRCLAERRRRTLCFVISIVEAVCLQPFGAVLGILSIIVLQRPSVKAAFEANDADATPAPTASPQPLAF